MNRGESLKTAAVVLCFLLASVLVVFAVTAQRAPIQPVRVEQAGERAAPQKVDNPLNINSATAEALQTLPGIGAVMAERIVAYREAHGAFHDLNELGEVAGIGSTTLEKLWPYIICA